LQAIGFSRNFDACWLLSPASSLVLSVVNLKGAA